MRTLVLIVSLFLIAPLPATAQGVQRGEVHGTISDTQGRALAGVALTFSSPELQGARQTTSDASGDYRLNALPPGSYEITFERAGFATVTVTLTVPLATPVVHDVVMPVARLQENVVVTVDRLSPEPTAAAAVHYTKDLVDRLPLPRTVQGIAQLAPAVSEYTPSSNQLVIHGAFAFDNIFMVDGVDINDNLRAQPQALYVEEAIAETQVLTSGITADYGRFGGGVVNVATKNGGNELSGSMRINFLNPAWTSETPYEVANGNERLNKTQAILEATLGGPLRRDRLWFFAAGRREGSTASNTLPMTGDAYLQQTDNRRADVKLTATVAPASTIQGGYVVNNTTTVNGSGALPYIIDRHALDVVRVPNWSAFTNYRGVTGTTLLEAQYSGRRFTTGGGGQSTAIADSPFFSIFGLGPYIWNAPYFDSADPEERNNFQLTGSLTRSWDHAGHHNTKTGYEFFRSQRSGGGSQSATGLVFFADFATNASGSPLYDPQGRLIPVFEPGLTAVDVVSAQRGAVLDVDTQSAFVTDRWQIDDRWTLDLGARVEHTRAVSTGNIVSVNGARLLPRLAAAYDPTGQQKQVLRATYSAYGGRYNEAQIGANSPVANAPELLRFYTGPSGQGLGFDPGFSLANYPATPDNAEIFTPPASNVFIDPNLRSPLTHEVTLGYATQLRRGDARATYVWRQTRNLIEDFQTPVSGTTNVVLDGIDAGPVTNRILANSREAYRDYQAVVLETSHRLTSRWQAAGHYTVQLRNHGNYEGETAAVPGATSLIGNFPEVFPAERFFPTGRLQSYQRHKLRAWTTYTLGARPVGDLALSALWSVDSGRVYSLTATLPLSATQEQLLADAGYPDYPSPNPVFFGPRGAATFQGSSSVDFAGTLNVRETRSWRPWIKFEVFNVFNNQSLTGWNTRVAADASSQTDAFGLPTGYVPGPLYGQATSATHYAQPFNGLTGGRTLRIALGVRF